MIKQKTSNIFAKNGHNIILALASILFIASLFYVAVFTNGANRVEAQSSDEYLSGWAWGDNFGWISFDCNDTSSCATANYRVDVAQNGDLSGYAWSDNMGWITFNEVDLSGCPSGACKAKLTGNSTKQLTGWARALSNGDEWDGWISLNGTNYGITLDNNNEFTGYAWDASDIVGSVATSECPAGMGLVSFEDGDLCIKNNTGPQTVRCDADPGQTYPDGIFSFIGDAVYTIADGVQIRGFVQDNRDLNNSDSGYIDPGVDMAIDHTLNIMVVDKFANKGQATVFVKALSGGIKVRGEGNTKYRNCGWTGLNAWPDTASPGTYNININNKAIGSGWIDFNPPFGGVLYNNTSGPAECSDTIDNADPEDTRIDTNDAGCYDTGAYDPNDDDETDTLPQCSNFFDDDGDGKVDYPNDPGCVNANDNDETDTLPQCSNNFDDDGDGVNDVNDPDCYDSNGYDPNDNNESGSGGGSQCTDGIDNDGDGKIDYPSDGGCSNASDNDESGNGVSGPAECSDTIDNADPEDTRIDTNDAGCYDTGAYDPNDDDETDTLPQCSNFFDDDGDGKIDYKTDGTGDSGCSNASDNKEQNFSFIEF